MDPRLFAVNPGGVDLPQVIARSVDVIQMAVISNEICAAAMTSLFNKCFSTIGFLTPQSPASCSHNFRRA
jgi:hypothetical protein